MNTLEEIEALINASEAATAPEVAPEQMLTDAGNAELFIQQHGADLRWVPSWNTWVRYDGTRWARTPSEAMIPLAIDTARSYYGIAAELGHGERERATKLVKHALASESAGRLEAMIRTARMHRAAFDDFDRDAWALNVANGTIDLRTGELRPHVREDMHTQISTVEYDPSAVAPTWDRFLIDVVPDAEVRSWLQRFTGYSMTGVIRDQILTFLYGKGANGKSTFLGAIQDAFGDYAFQGPPGLLLASERGDEVGRRQRASLIGRRLVVCQEIEAGRYLNESQAKTLTGSDKISAARLYEHEIEFTPTHKLVLATNYRPIIRGQDHGMWRRVRLVPFTTTIPPEQRDPTLADKLHAERAGILAWAVRGCLEWQRSGLKPPAAISAATDAYQTDEDRLAEFIESTCEAGPGFMVTVGDLHGRYRSWCTTRGETPWSARAFGDALDERGYKRDRQWMPERKRTERVLIGLRIRPLVLPS